VKRGQGTAFPRFKNRELRDEAVLGMKDEGGTKKGTSSYG